MEEMRSKCMTETRGMLDRSLTYRRHLESLRKKLTSCIALLRRLAGSGWDAGVTTLRTATLPWFIQQNITALLSGAAVLTIGGGTGGGGRMGLDLRTIFSGGPGPPTFELRILPK